MSDSTSLLPPEHASSLALLFMALAYGTDHDLHEAERSTMIDLVRRWIGEPDHAEGIVDAAFVAVRSRPALADLEQRADVLRPVLSRDLRREVLSDLAMIARADGVLSIEEVEFVQQLRRLWA